MTCADAIAQVFAAESGPLSVNDVIQRAYTLYPERPWKENTIRRHLDGLSVNHPSGRHHPSLQRRAFLFYLGNGRFRRMDPGQDEAGQAGAAQPTEPDEMTDRDADVLFGAIDMTVSLERDLERALVSNLAQLEPGLRLYRGEGRAGQQLDTGVVGRMDILAVDARGDLVVIELKAGEADDRVCGQVLRYMGWVSQNLADGRKVRGVIVANEFGASIQYAAKTLPSVALKRYSVHFEFTDG